MLIGEISNKAGLSRDTIRFYEKKGLITVARTDSKWNNYKYYSAKNLSQLLLIKKAKGFGFTLNEIAELLELFEMNMADCTTMETRIGEKIKKIDNQIIELQAMKKMIQTEIKMSQVECVPTSENSNCNILS